MEAARTIAVLTGGGSPPVVKHVNPQGGGALSPLFLECSAVLVASTAQERGAPLRYAPFGVTSTARGALPEAGWDEGMVVAVEPRDGTRIRRRGPRQHVLDRRWSGF